jgi:hypothetical protein
MTVRRRWLPVAMLAVWALVGFGRAAHQAATAARAPAWERHLAPLADAPIAAGTAVALVAATAGGGADLKLVLMEAAWQRPDLRWALLSSWPAGPPPAAVVTVGAVAVPPGFRQAWRQGLIAVHTKGGP